MEVIAWTVAGLAGLALLLEAAGRLFPTRCDFCGGHGKVVGHEMLRHCQTCGRLYECPLA